MKRMLFLMLLSVGCSSSLEYDEYRKTSAELKKCEHEQNQCEISLAKERNETIDCLSEKITNTLAETHAFVGCYRILGECVKNGTDEEDIKCMQDFAICYVDEYKKFKTEKL